MPFVLHSSTYQVQTRRALLDNSLSVSVGDAIIPLTADSTIVTNATAAVAGTGRFLLGVVVGFSREQGEVVGGGQDPATTPASFTTAANNTTVARIHAVYIPFLREQEWLVDLTAVMGTTVGTLRPFAWFNLADARTVGEATVLHLEAAGTPLQLLKIANVPGETRRAVFKVAQALLTRP